MRCAAVSCVACACGAVAVVWSVCRCAVVGGHSTLSISTVIILFVAGLTREAP